MEIKLIVADDHSLFRKGLIALLRDYTGIKIIGEAESGRQLIDIINAEKESIDIILLDLAMNDLSGYEILKKLRKDKSPIKTLVISMYDDNVSIRKAFEEGANGYLYKGADTEDIFKAIKSITEKGFYFNEKANLALFNKTTPEGKPRILNTKASIKFSDREIKIIQMFGDGLSNSEVGEKLFISHRTVETIRQHMIKKVGVRNVIGLVLFAVKNRLIDIS
ncbi:MAG TPA: response regulator transcription factor [Chitinophagales bacterium]|nr:response regulator transcription factor [Chitinophagales bacterium]